MSVTVRVQGPLVPQAEAAARLAAAFISGAEALWDAATLDDAGEAWEAGRAAASFVLAACHRAELRMPKKAPQAAATPTEGTATAQTLLPGLAAAPVADPG